jgi:hypothetical protein
MCCQPTSRARRHCGPGRPPAPAGWVTARVGGDWTGPTRVPNGRHTRRLIPQSPAARAIGDEHWKAHTLAALAPCLSAALADQAFQNAANLQDDGDRAQVLESLATLQANSSPMPDLHRWTGVLWMLAIRRRRNLLDDLCALAPLIAKSGGQPAVGRAVAAIETSAGGDPEIGGCAGHCVVSSYPGQASRTGWGMRLEHTPCSA